MVKPNEILFSVYIAKRISFTSLLLLVEIFHFICLHSISIDWKVFLMWWYTVCCIRNTHSVHTKKEILCFFRVNSIRTKLNWKSDNKYNTDLIKLSIAGKQNILGWFFFSVSLWCWIFYFFICVSSLVQVRVHSVCSAAPQRF